MISVCLVDVVGVVVDGDKLELFTQKWSHVILTKVWSLAEKWHFNFIVEYHIMN